MKLSVENQRVADIVAEIASEVARFLDKPYVLEPAAQDKLETLIMLCLTIVLDIEAGDHSNMQTYMDRLFGTLERIKIVDTA